MLAQQLPAVLQHIADTLQSHSTKVLIASSSGLEGQAAVVAVAHASCCGSQDVYHALVELQHCYTVLQVRSAGTCSVSSDAFHISGHQQAHMVLHCVMTESDGTLGISLQQVSPK